MSFQHIKRDVDLFSSYFNALAEDHHGFIWFGSLGGGGLYRFDGYTLRSFLPNPSSLGTSIAGSRIHRVYVAPHGKLYVGTNFGFSIIHPVTGHIRSINNRYDLSPHGTAGWTNAFLVDTIHDALWIGTGYGLARMNVEATDSFIMMRPNEPVDPYTTPHNIGVIIQDTEQPHILWMTSSQGLFSYDIKHNRYTLIPSPVVPGLNMSVVDMYRNHAGTFWMVAGEGFVLGYNPVNQKWIVHRMPMPDETPAEIRAFINIHPAGDQEAWISNMNSVGKINLMTGHFEGWTHSADRPEGLLPKGAYRDILNDRHGRLWVTSFFGVQYARQAFMEKSGAATKLKVAITDLDVSPIYDEKESPLFYTENVSLHKDQRDVSFQYVLPNPLNAASVTYQYMLSGYDKEWITTDQRRVRYPKLGGGTYSFLVRARESEDQDWTATTSMNIQIPKRISEFWWFWGILGSLLLALAILLNKMLVSRAKKQERLKAEFEHQVSEIQMQALRAQMNPHFLFNSLNSIKYFAISKSKEETAAYLSKFSLLVRSILNNSKSRTISLKDELDALQLYIEIEHLRLDGKFDYLIDIDSSIHIKQAQIPPMILQPYVENAIWHGLMHKEGRGKLLVQVKDMGHQIQCIIEDNGIGRAQAAEYRGKQTEHKHSVGMQITSDRIALINRIYHIDTQVHVIDLADFEGHASGTRVVINIPLIRDEEE